MFAVVALVAVSAPAAMPGKPGEVRPTGWIRDRAVAAKNGYTGHLDEVDRHFRIAWTTNAVRTGAQLFWGDRENGCWSAEAGSYWFDGLIKLAWQLDDPELKTLAKEKMEPVLSHMNDKAIGFLWWLNRDVADDQEQAFNEFGSWHFWVAGNAERVFAAWYEATGDRRVLTALEQAFGWSEVAIQTGGKASMPSGMIDAYRLTKSPAIAEAIDLAVEKFRRGDLAQYTAQPWSRLADTLWLKRVHTGYYKIPDRHGVAACEALLSALRIAQHSGDKALLKCVLAWVAFWDENCRQPYGCTAADEEWGWRGAHRGTETCTVAAESFLRANLLCETMDGKWGDDLERAFFNAGAGCVTPDYRRHVYFQFPNRVERAGATKECSCTGLQYSLYGKCVWPFCCTAALNRILPNYVQYQWLTADDGVVAALYGPSTFATTVKGRPVAFEERTDYPFDERIEIAVTEASGAAFPLKLRIPAWCKGAQLTVNGENVAAAPTKGFVTLTRTWKKGDVVRLDFPMTPFCEEFRDHNELGTLRRSVYLGPLLFAYYVPTADGNDPTGPVREPILPKVFAPTDFTLVRTAMPKVWNWQPDAPLKLKTRDADGQSLELVPYGCTQLRISAFQTQN